MAKTGPTTITEYIAAAPAEARPKLRELRAMLKRVAPKAKEGLKWGNPAFDDGRILFAFAAYRTHLNFMPTPAALKPFLKELAKYTTGKSSVQFPYDKPLPKALIRRIAAFRVKQVRERDAKWM
ncbi:MAG: DUF1801 domain-containing protein [Gemmatimonadales bacterium]